MHLWTLKPATSEMTEVLSQPFTFLNLSFWLFLGVVLVGMATVEKRVQARNAFLFLASLFFYWKTSGAFVAILVLPPFRTGGWAGGYPRRTSCTGNGG